MDLEKLKVQQAALKAHSSSQKQLAALVKTLVDGPPTLRNAIFTGFTSLGLRADVTWGLTSPKWRVTVPPSKRSLEIEVLENLEFDGEHLRSVFKLRSGDSDRLVPAQTPMALPIEITVGESYSDRLKYSIWWRGPSDTERLTTIILDLFKGKRGPDELGVGVSKCFVATVVFGARSEEVAILRKWRDERLSESIVGRVLVKAYYGLGPFCAAVVQGNAVIRRLARAVLLAVCRWLSRRT